MRTDRGDLLVAWPLYWGIILGPPLLLLILGALISWIFEALENK